MRVAGPGGHLALAALAVLIAAAPYYASTYQVGFLATTLVAALFALSLQMLVGAAGMVSLGHAALFGVGAYTVWFLTPAAGSASIVATLPAAALAGAAVALAIGALSLRTRGFFFLMTTLAFGQMVFFIFHDTALGGGADGVFITRPALGLGDWVWDVPRRQRPAVLLWLNLGVLVVMYAGLAGLMRTLYGRALLGIRANEHRMSALGLPAYRYKLAAFVLGGALAGIAGHQWAMTEAFVSPELLGWHRSALALLAIVLGGVGWLHGPILGALAFAILGEVAGLITERQHLVEGLVILAVVLALPQGLAGLGLRAPAPAPVEGPVEGPGVTALLQANGLVRRFGGLAAVGGVSLTLARGCLHAVIGPNGAGKSTLVNLLSGELPPSGGTIHVAGQDTTGWPAWRFARAGVGRSFQRTNVLRDMTVAENVRLAAQIGITPPGRLLRRASTEAEPLRRAAAALDRAGLSDLASRDARILSHGQLRQLEIAMVLATAPHILLLDEPLAGMGPEEAERIATLLRALAQDHALLLIEHDMDVVFAVADYLTVMVDGLVLDEGPPAHIRASDRVRDAYLGHAA